MTPEEDRFLRELAGKNICPNCGEHIQEGKCQRYGNGAFCSLDCVGLYNASDLVERHKRILAAQQRHQDS
jgi:hypothetical protein